MNSDRKGERNCGVVKTRFEVSWGLNLFYISNCWDALDYMYYIWVRLTKINMCANKQLIFEKFVQVHPAYVLPGFLVNSGISKNSDYSLLLGTKAGLFFYPFHRNCWIFLLRQLSFLVSYYPIWLGTLSTVRILNFSCTIVQKKIIKNIW